ncbi:MAG TPA: hypothetical protein VGX28_01860 [Frankiaceae bacterium]|jgi:hypothetical protein|nr:hypothetical protein [Frankiaceae bacterium]
MPLPLVASVLASSLVLPPTVGVTVNCTPAFTTNTAPYDLTLTAEAVLPPDAVAGGFTCSFQSYDGPKLVATASGSAPVLVAATSGTVPTRQGLLCVSPWYRTATTPDGTYITSSQQCS